ncbi:MAG: serine protease [Bacilli bacterium]|nr:serine protease [Bacilli bacterium]
MNKKNIKKQIIPFILGVIITLLILDFRDLVLKKTNYNNLTTREKTTIYDKSSLAPAVKKIYDAVVVIKSYDGSVLSETGTGFVYKTDSKYAYILTNEHIVTSASKVITILPSGEEINAKLLGKDAYLDLAVLRIEKKYISLVATIGSSENMELGDTVFTIGTPVGEDYRGSVTAGILSGKDRMVETSVSSSEWIMKVLQVDAAINPGNSGGPLLNTNGEVIGICSMKLVDNDIEGIGFAIPIEDAIKHVELLEKGKEKEWPTLGIKMSNVTDSDAELEGVVVVEIKENSSVADSDLKKDDIITKINDTKIKNTGYLKYELYQHQVGETIEITYLRNNKEQKTKVKLKSSD